MLNPDFSGLILICILWENTMKSIHLLYILPMATRPKIQCLQILVAFSKNFLWASKISLTWAEEIYERN